MSSQLIVSHITFPDCPVHTFSNNCLEIAVYSSWCFPFCGEWNSLKWNKTWIIWPWCNFSGALLRAKHAQQRTMVNIREILVITWPFVHPPVRPFAPKAYQCKITQSTGMATQMALEVFGSKLRGLPDFREKKTTTMPSFFRLSFTVYTERAWDNRHLLEKQHENFISAARKWEMLAVSKEKPAR